MRAGLAVVVAASLNMPIGAAEAQEAHHPTLELVSDGSLALCVRPNARRKSCAWIDTFEPVNEGVYFNVAFIGAGNGVTIEYQTPVWLGERGYCGTVREQDFYAAVVRLNGREVPTNLAQAALDGWARENRKWFDREFCTWYEGSGGDFVAKTSIDGEYQPDKDEPVRVVGRADGYRALR